MSRSRSRRPHHVYVRGGGRRYQSASLTETPKFSRAMRVRKRNSSLLLLPRPPHLSPQPAAQTRGNRPINPSINQPIRPMPPSVATHASLLLKAAAAAAHLHPKPFFSPRAAPPRIPSAPAPPAAGGSRYRPTTTTTAAATATSATAACRWFRWPPPAQAPVRGLCSLPHSGGGGGGGEGMGSEGVGRRRRVVAPAVNGVAKDGAPQPPPPKLLTLPTVLTIGRVAAVPLLISSKFERQLVCSC